MVSKFIAWTFSFQLSNQHRNGLILSHMPMHLCICSINTHPGLTKCQTLLDGGTYGCMSHIPDLRGLTHWWGRQGRDQHRGLSTRVGTGHCPKCMIQILFLPTRNSSSKGRSKYKTKLLCRWHDVSLGSDFPKLKAFLVLLHFKWVIPKWDEGSPLSAFKGRFLPVARRSL